MGLLGKLIKAPLKLHKKVTKAAVGIAKKSTKAAVKVAKKTTPGLGGGGRKKAAPTAPARQSRPVAGPTKPQRPTAGGGRVGSMVRKTPPGRKF